MMHLNRRLNRPLGLSLERCLNRYVAGHPWRPANDLARACTLIGKYIRLRRKTAKAQPHIFGRHAGTYYRDTCDQAAAYDEIDAALEKIYGSDPTGPPRSSSVWTERYSIPPEKMQAHRKWFRENYGA